MDIQTEMNVGNPLFIYIKKIINFSDVRLFTGDFHDVIYDINNTSFFDKKFQKNEMSIIEMYQDTFQNKSIKKTYYLNGDEIISVVVETTDNNNVTKKIIFDYCYYYSDNGRLTKVREILRFDGEHYKYGKHHIVFQIKYRG